MLILPMPPSEWKAGSGPCLSVASYTMLCSLLQYIN